MVKKLPIRVRMKLVIEALREGKKTWTELLKLGIPEKTLHRILNDYLVYWNLARKEGNYWVWYEHIRVFDSKYDYDLALEHSRKLIPALENLISLDWKPHELEFAVKQHLKSYPEIYRKLETVEKNFMRRARELKAKPNSYQNLYFLQMEENMEIYKQLSGDIHSLILKIKMGQPLEGVCSICPKIRITEDSKGGEK